MMNCSRTQSRENERYLTLEYKIGRVNNTIHSFPKAYALMAEALHFSQSIKTYLNDLDHEHKKGGISTAINLLTRQNSFPEEATKYSSIKVSL